MSIELKGKSYTLVSERVAAFRNDHPEYSLISEIISNEGGVVTIKASVINEQGRVLATGHAQEKEGSSFINKTSHVENCETSAWGRALGNFGYGIDSSIATAEEVLNAQIQQATQDKGLFAKEAEEMEFDELLTKYKAKVKQLKGSAENVQEYFQKRHGKNIYEVTVGELKKALKLVEADIAKLKEAI